MTRFTYWYSIKSNDGVWINGKEQRKNGNHGFGAVLWSRFFLTDKEMSDITFNTFKFPLNFFSIVSLEILFTTLFLHFSF